MINLCFPEYGDFGWGVCSRNITAALWDKKATIHAISPHSDPDPLERIQMFPGPLLQAIRGVDFIPLCPDIRGSSLNVGYGFIENNLEMAKYVQNATNHYDVICCGSTWMKECLQEVWNGRVEVVVQGVDFERFKPNRLRPAPDHFTIYSAGKFEFRKGQDIVIRAVAHMMHKYPDVRLVANWFNPWPATAESMRHSSLIDYSGDIMGAMMKAGVDMRRVSGGIGFPIPNAHMQDFITRCDIGLFPNRCEAGTNLAMMECLACGVPVIASYSTGHKDVIKRLGILNAYEFTAYREEDPIGIWSEPVLEEVISSLEHAYSIKDKLPEFGDRMREDILPFTWENAAQKFLDIMGVY